MKTIISQDGTIGNFGDIQPDWTSFPDFSVLDPGVLPGPLQLTSGLGAATPAPVTLSMTPFADAAYQPAVTMASSAGIASDSSDSAGIATASGLISVGPVLSNSLTYAPLVITPAFGSSITSLTGTKADPTTAAEVEGAIDAAINYYDTNWTSSVPAGTVINGSTISTVDVTIEFGYGQVGTVAMASGPASSSSYGLTTVGNGHYSAVLADLSGVLPNLPGSDPTGGAGTFYATNAQSQMLGLSTPGTAAAGDVGLNTVANGVTLDYNLANQSVAGEVGAVGAIEHEISEVFGRTAGLGAFGANTYTIFDLYRFSASNTPALKAGSADDFSVNSGTTALGYFNNQAANGGDAGDWASSGTHNVPADAYDAFFTTGTAGTISALDKTVLANIGFQAACFVSGTLIETARGPVAVENLREGDQAVLHTGGTRPVRWLGYRRIDLTRHKDPERARPIRIRADAFADGSPRRDLLVSPDHAMFVGGVLIPARFLINGASIIQETKCRDVAYFHVELDRHDILLAEGTPTESYLDTGNRALFENGGQALLLHPDFTDSQHAREAGSCVPFADGQAEVEPVWRALAERAEALGWDLPEPPALEDEPDLHLRVGTRRVRPVLAQQGCYTFVIPADDAPMRLVSRLARPCDPRPWVSDDRRLGVKIRRLTLRRGLDVRDVAMDDTRLDQGWWAVEWDDRRPCRWTNGDATLPPLGAGVLEVELAGTMRYPVERPVSAGGGTLQTAAPRRNVAENAPSTGSRFQRTAPRRG
jgi:hypothetical protein